MKLIQLTRKQNAMVDDHVFQYLSGFSWIAQWNSHTESFYAVGRDPVRKDKKIKMHRHIMGITDPKIKVDHKNHNTLDNQKSNLRIATNSQNCANRSGPNSNSTSGFRGVCFHKSSGKWTAQIQVNGKRTRLGLFSSPETAAAAFSDARKKYYGEFGGR